MKNYTNSEVLSLITRFENLELPKAEWTHEAHLVVAVWYCFRHSFDEAMGLVRANITNHNAAVGTPNTDIEGYHETITRFWLLVASRFLNETPSNDIAELCNAFINSEYSASSYPLSFYSAENLFSVQARRNWVEPDLKKLI